MTHQELNESLELTWNCWVVYDVSSCVGFLICVCFVGVWCFCLILCICVHHVELLTLKDLLLFKSFVFTCLLIPLFAVFLICLHKWLMWPLVYLQRHAPHVRLRQSCRIFKLKRWVEAGQEDSVSGGKSSNGVDVVPMWRNRHVVLVKFWLCNGGVSVVLLCGGTWRWFGPRSHPSFPLLSFPQSAL